MGSLTALLRTHHHPTSTAASSPYKKEIYITSEATQFTSPEQYWDLVERLHISLHFMNSQASGTYMSAIGQPSLPPRQTVIEDSYVDKA